MLDILQVTFPFFAPVLCGYVAARWRMLPFEAISGLNSFVLYFTLPCMLFRFGAATPIRNLLDPAALGVYLPCALALVAAVVWASLNPRIRWNDAAFGAPVALFTIGAVLARSHYVAALEAHDPMPPRDYLPIVLVKLAVHPLLVLGPGSVAIALGRAVARFTLEVTVLVAALPSASNVSVLAERFGANTGRIILLTTALAFLTFSAAVALFR